MEGWGVDGCRAGWVFFGLDGGAAEYGVVETSKELVARMPAGATALVDVPIGLPETADAERACDLHGRRVLSPTRTSSVFPAPCRAAAYAPSYEEATRLNRERLGKGLSRQSWAIAPKIREVDSLLQEEPGLRGRIRETHPEVCFWGLAGRPMRHSKRTRAGLQERLETLAEVHPDAVDLIGRAFLELGGVAVLRDDVVDAFVAALCASRISECKTLPPEPELDPTGLPMEIVYWPATPG